MKKILFFFALLVISLSSFAQQTSNSITVSGSRFTYDLLRQWIQDFNEEYPDAVIQIVPRETPYAEQANLVINAHNLDILEIREGYEYIKLGRYVILPVANEKNTLVRLYKNRPIKQQELKDLYFDPLQEEVESSEVKRVKKQSIQLYTRQRFACSNTTFATYYGFKVKDIKGRPIVGEDKHLLYAISKDTSGVTYSIPGIFYDLQTRKIKKGVSILKTESLANAIAKEKLDLSNLDSFINYLEANVASADFPVTYFHISLKKNVPENSIERKFLQHVLTKGQTRLHEFGFLNPEEPVRTQSIQLVNF
jgi:phosphate transport system substrate-binding protein